MPLILIMDNNCLNLCMCVYVYENFRKHDCVKTIIAVKSCNYFYFACMVSVCVNWWVNNNNY